MCPAGSIYYELTVPPARQYSHTRYGSLFLGHLSVSFEIEYPSSQTSEVCTIVTVLYEMMVHVFNDGIASSAPLSPTDTSAAL